MRDAGDGCLMTKMMCFERGGIIPRAYAMIISISTIPFLDLDDRGRRFLFYHRFFVLSSPRLRE